MELTKLGERKIIEIFSKTFGRCKKAAVGIGDDAAVFELGDERDDEKDNGDKNYLVISTDFISEKSHIPKEMSPYQIGQYVVNVNLSDIASMGAKPVSMLFSFGLPGELDETFVTKLSRGINDACKEHGVCVIGGDTKEHSEIAIAGTALGISKKARVMKRSGAGVGDLICVTGKIGLAAAGVLCITRGLEIEEKIKKRLIKAALEPKARVEEGISMAKDATSCMDVSDGLAFSLHEMARAGGKGFVVEEEKVPTDRGIKEVSRQSNVSTREIMFHKGGDYELLFTVPPEKLAGLEKHVKLTVIGKITKRGKEIVTKEGTAEPLDPKGYESFKIRR